MVPLALIYTSLASLIAWNQYLIERETLAKENDELEQQLMESGDAEQEQALNEELRRESRVMKRDVKELENGKGESWA